MEQVERTRVNIRMESSLCDFYEQMSDKLNISRNYLMLVALRQFKESYSKVDISYKGLLNYLESLN